MGIPKDDQSAMSAAEIIDALFKADRFGRNRGVPCAEISASSFKSDYVKLASESFGCIVHIENSVPEDNTSHPYWVWIERR